VSDARAHAFITVLFSKDWPPAHHLAGLRGYFMRRHVDGAHPDHVERIEELSAAEFSDAAQLAAWLFGYRYEAK
jgi:hypothetical protein